MSERQTGQQRSYAPKNAVNSSRIFLEVREAEKGRTSKDKELLKKSFCLFLIDKSTYFTLTIL